MRSASSSRCAGRALGLGRPSRTRSWSTSGAQQAARPGGAQRDARGGRRGRGRVARVRRRAAPRSAAQHGARVGDRRCRSTSEGLDVDALETRSSRATRSSSWSLQPACRQPDGAGPLARASGASGWRGLAVERNFFVMEDRGVRGHCASTASRAAPDPRAGVPAHVIYVNSLSKAVGRRAARPGWVAARGPVREQARAAEARPSDFLSRRARSSTWPRAGSPAGRTTTRYVRGARSAFYRERRDALHGGARAAPGRASTGRRCRAGGHHVWVTLTRSLDERSLYSEAQRHGVAFTPGGAVTVERRSQVSLRLSFSLLDPAEDGRRSRPACARTAGARATPDGRGRLRSSPARRAPRRRARRSRGGSRPGKRAAGRRA